MLMFYIKTKSNIGLGHGPGGEILWSWDLICQHRMMSAEEETFFTKLQTERKWTTQRVGWFIMSFFSGEDIFLLFHI